MKKLQLAMVVVLSSLAYSASAQNYGCDRKMQSLETQLNYAKQHGNVHRQRGLERAIANVQTHCTDAYLLRDLQEDIDDQQEDIDDILEEIQEKQTEGRVDKVERLQRKLERKRQKLADLQAEMEDLQSMPHAEGRHRYR
ncbi:DUF1090 domain-containing protein [Alcaligenaceae bacterium 429]|uniref:DUF1090 domain-containing protein n=1 Tax=Paenalcaligenes sp. Me52 TaxID=3392038 RepID=UPI0010926971|nr:DUF1090 domain-containing protein [Alcaligenaceae bacterium 429]